MPLVYISSFRCGCRHRQQCRCCVTCLFAFLFSPFDCIFLQKLFCTNNFMLLYFCYYTYFQEGVAEVFFFCCNATTNNEKRSCLWKLLWTLEREMRISCNFNIELCYITVRLPTNNLINSISILNCILRQSFYIWNIMTNYFEYKFYFVLSRIICLYTCISFQFKVCSILTLKNSRVANKTIYVVNFLPIKLSIGEKYFFAQCHIKLYTTRL